jgi:hypothetical protein
LGRQFMQALLKTIKFGENPSPLELIKEQSLVLSKFEDIYVSIRGMTIRLELSPKK